MLGKTEQIELCNLERRQFSDIDAVAPSLTLPIAQPVEEVDFFTQSLSGSPLMFKESDLGIDYNHLMASQVTQPQHAEYLYDMYPLKPQLLMANFDLNWEQSFGMDEKQKRYASLEDSNDSFVGLAGKDTDVTLYNGPSINLDLM